MKWPDDADGLLNKLFKIIYLGQERIKQLPQYEDTIILQPEAIILQFENITLNWLKDIKISDIRSTVSVLSELDFIIAQLFGIATPISQRFFRLHYLLEILQPAIELSRLNIFQGKKLSQININKESLGGMKIAENCAEDWILIVARIQHVIQIFFTLPEIFPSIPVYSYMLSTYLNNFFDQELIKSSAIKPTAIVLAEHKYIRKILQYINLMSKEDESAAVVGYLARSGLDINMYINNAPLLEKDNKTVQIILRNNQNPTIRFNQKEIPAKINEISKMIPTIDKYLHEPRYDNAITALIGYSLREEAISKAAEDASFDNIISALALFKQDQNLDKIVDPLSHLLEQAKEGQKLKKERNKPFGYRIANLLGCNLIEDNEAQIARSVINTILHISNTSQNILDDFGLDKPIFLSIKEYVERLLVEEIVPLETTPLIDIQTALAFGNQIAQWIVDAGQKLIIKAQNSFNDAIEVAKMIKLERSGLFFYSLRLRCLCEDNRLDGYFSEQESSAFNNLQDICKKFMEYYQQTVDESFAQAYDNFKRQFPNIEIFSKQRGQNSLFREGMIIGVKIVPQQIRSIIPAILMFIPLFAPIDFNRTRNLRIDPTIIVRNEDQSIIGKDFNALIGGTGKDLLRFISPFITADFGIHIDRAQTSNCGSVTIDNLSSDDVTVELKDIQENNLKIKLASNLVNVGEKIDIQFNVVEQPSEEPSLASIIFKIVALSKKQSNQTAICEIRAFIRRTPLCALIESSSSLMLSSATSCTLAPKKFTEQIYIKHHIPSVILSQKAIGWSLTSNDANVADEPKIQLDEEKQKMMIQFESDTTGLCAGQMTVGFGLSELYKLRLNVPVSQYPLVEIYHPANPKLTDISLVQSDYTHIIVRNNGNEEREILLKSSEQEDYFESNSFILNPHSSKLVRIQFGDALKHTISIGKQRIMIKLVKNKPKYDLLRGNAHIEIDEGVYFPCWEVNNDGTQKFEYMKRQTFKKDHFPSIVTENECMNKTLPLKAYKNYQGFRRWILDPKQGLINIEANVTEPTGACALWAETRENHEYIRIIDESLDNDIQDAVDKIEEVNRLTERQTAGIPKLLVEASNIFLTSKNKLGQLDRDSVLRSAKKSMKEKNEQLIFSQIILALDNEVQRQSDKAIPEIITEICRQVTKRENWSTSVPPVPTTWTGKDKENKINGMHLIWGAITLLGTLRNPHLLMSREIDILQQKLQQGPPNPELIQKQIEKGENEVAQEMNGKKINCIGIIYGRFTEAEAVQRLFDKIENIKPPEFPHLTKIQENINTNLIKDLQKQVELKFEQLISKFQTIKNPSELNQLLIQIPSLSRQIIIAAQCAENQNISKLISGLSILTIIVQELQKSKENNQLLGSQIQKSIQGCYRVWAQLIKAGITPPAELNLSKDILNKYNSNISNVQIEPIPECSLQPGVWRTQEQSSK
ncbi:MAG: hypothetical protein EZS28_012676 [Streblomastix strix]|uniref:Uncharacterized protein n=1 Tax=Streblomastix strix TaxID=222440 RepID=A0A5J4WA84_9EUKA|nr:MAG: hypothetical protein EZS28_012676 [Streblomastix strix]